MSFDLLAPHYRWMEPLTAGSLLQECRVRHLDHARNAKRALVLGPGPGRFVAELLRSNPRVEITCVEASARMLELTRARVQAKEFSARKVTCLHTDLLQWEPEAGAYDLVASHFFLDCFTPDQLPQVARKVQRALIPGGHWLISDFREPDAGWKRLRGKLVLAGMYAFFRIATKLPAKRLTDPSPILAAQGFTLRQRDVRHHGLLHADVWVRD